jgi:hypothetical protein
MAAVPGARPGEVRVQRRKHRAGQMAPAVDGAPRPVVGQVVTTIDHQQPALRPAAKFAGSQRGRDRARLRCIALMRAIIAATIPAVNPRMKYR